MSTLAQSMTYQAWENFESGACAWEDFSATEQEAIVKHYMPKIRFFAQRIKRRMGTLGDLNELISAGTLGLMESLGKFIPSRGIPFESFAESRICGSMLDDLRKEDFLSRGTRKNTRAIHQANLSIESLHGRSATEEELSELTGLSIKEVRRCMELSQGQQQISIELFSETLTKEDIESGGTPYTVTMNKELFHCVQRLFIKLTEKERQVLHLYYKEECTMLDIGANLKISEGRVSQIHSQALKQLRKFFNQNYGSL